MKRIKKYVRVIDLMASLNSTEDFYRYKALHYEALVGDKKDRESVRVNDQYRIEFHSEVWGCTRYSCRFSPKIADEIQYAYYPERNVTTTLTNSSFSLSKPPFPKQRFRKYPPIIQSEANHRKWKDIVRWCNITDLQQ